MSTNSASTKASPRARVRDLFPTLYQGRHSPGPKNSLTDVPGVLVSTTTIQRLANLPAHDVINTGLTTILPRKDWFKYSCHAGIFRFNGSGEMTGSHWIEETGLLSSPVIVTASFSVGQCYAGIYEYAIREYADKKTGLADWFLLPVVAETYDGYMSDIAHSPIVGRDVVEGIDRVSEAAVEEGCRGGGTGMLCCGFKSGTGSASRVVKGACVDRDESKTELKQTTYTVGALVQANFGAQIDFKVGGAPVGRIIFEEKQREKAAAAAAAAAAEEEKGGNPQAQPEDDPEERNKDGSIIVILATDAPLHPLQLQRLAKRATVGVARVGGWGSNTSGDIFLAFSTGNKIEREPGMSRNVVKASTLIPLVEDQSINSLFEAAADAVEEAILNALFMAEDTKGPQGVEVKAIDLDRVKEIVEKYTVTTPEDVLSQIK